ncbi:MAG: tRNA adenosine(34) deaminase TadA [Planctomycetota bacterium]
MRERRPMGLGGQEASALDVKMMRCALELARKAGRDLEVPVGAVVYETATGKVLASAHNRREKDLDPSAHAEFIAMREASRTLQSWRLTGCSVAVTLEPCPMCAGMIVNSRIDRLVYGAADPKAGAVRSLMRLADDPRLNHRAQIVPGVLAEECSQELRGFFKTLRSRKG